MFGGSWYNEPVLQTNAVFVCALCGSTLPGLLCSSRNQIKNQWRQCSETNPINFNLKSVAVATLPNFLPSSFSAAFAAAVAVNWLDNSLLGDRNGTGEREVLVGEYTQIIAKSTILCCTHKHKVGLVMSMTARTYFFIRF